MLNKIFELTIPGVGSKEIFDLGHGIFLDIQTSSERTEVSFGGKILEGVIETGHLLKEVDCNANVKGDLSPIGIFKIVLSAIKNLCQQRQTDVFFSPGSPELRRVYKRLSKRDNLITETGYGFACLY